MRAADQAIQRPPRARLLHLDAHGRLSHLPRSGLVQLLRPGDLVIANDAATLPASLQGVHAASGGAVEVRLAGRRQLALDDTAVFTAVVFGAGDYRSRTEDRPAPPPLRPGDRLQLGPLAATVLRLLDHPRLVELRFDGSAAAIWAGLARHGRPIQYAHLPQPLQLWDAWTVIAGPPVAYEAPSAGFALDWNMLAELRRRGVGFATLTHAAGISSTGDPELDRRLPFDEPYRIPQGTTDKVRRARAAGGRIVAIGTTVVRALEHAASQDCQVYAGEGLATQRLDRRSRLRVVDAILSGTHEPGSSHYQLLQAFALESDLRRADAELEARGYRTHEFGDSVLVERSLAKITASYRRKPVSRGDSKHSVSPGCRLSPA
jgi:S-adenosylmethionine:tRNA ribosyltransferase-isomerase